MTVAIPQHSSATQEHYTPSDIIERARKLLGGFDLDPASCVEANKRVGARRIYTETDDGLSKPWTGRVFLNPPGGRDREARTLFRSVTLAFWDKLTREWQAGNVTEAFFVGFTLEILRTSQRAALPVQAFPRCYPASRLHFIRPGGEAGHSPPHANVLVYLPERMIAPQRSLKRLAGVFSDVGLCERGGDYAGPVSDRPTEQLSLLEGVGT